jgi:hypothetical protein
MNGVLRVAGSNSGGRGDFENIRRIIYLFILGLFVLSRFVLSQFPLSRLIDLRTQSETHGSLSLLQGQLLRILSISC